MVDQEQKERDVFIAIDGSGPVLGVCVGRLAADGVAVLDSVEMPARQEVATLAKLVGQILLRNALSPGEVEKVFVSGGPGSFTGIRLTLSFALGFAPCGAEVSLVDSLASAVCGVKGSYTGPIVVAEEACRESLFVLVAQATKGKLQRLVTKSLRISDADISPFASEYLSSSLEPLLITSSARAMSLIPHQKLGETNRPVGVAVAWASGHAFQKGASAVERAQLAPNYGRGVMAKTILERAQFDAP